MGETVIGQGSLVCGVRNDLGNRNKGGVERAKVLMGSEPGMGWRSRSREPGGGWSKEGVQRPRA